MRSNSSNLSSSNSSSSGSNALQTGERNAHRQQHQQRPQPHVVPATDIFENDDGITLLADLPGVSRDNLGVRVDGDTLLIEATASAAGPDGMELIYGEVQLAAYRRQFTLSRELDATRIDAELKDGVLRLTIPKSEVAKPRRIEVRTA